MTSYFIAGAHTGVGKTLVTAALAHQHPGMRALKPLITGFSALEGSDSAMLLEAMNQPLEERELVEISPWRFMAPLAPSQAARLEARIIDWPVLLEFCLKDDVLVESVGGVMSPVTDAHTVLDWAKALGFPVILVGGTYLGAISHTLSALFCLQASRLPVKAIVVNESEDGIGLRETAEEVRRFSNVPIWQVPRFQGTQPWKALPILSLDS